MEPKTLRSTANGIELRVLEWLPDDADVGAEAGAPRPSTVFLVHGFMDAAGTWDLVAPGLARAGFRVLAPDMRGFGESARAPLGGYYHFVDYVFDFAELVDTLSPKEPIALVGHSMGGTIATLFAGAFPERVAHLALVEGVGPPDNPYSAGPVRMRAWIDQVHSLRARGPGEPSYAPEEALRRLATNHVNVPLEVLAHRLPHLARTNADGRMTWRFDPLHRTTSPMPFFAKLLVEFARKVTCPVLFVSGGPRGFHPDDEDERLAAFARLERAELPDAGHMIHWTKPEALVALLVAHFAR